MPLISARQLLISVIAGGVIGPLALFFLCISLGHPGIDARAVLVGAWVGVAVIAGIFMIKNAGGSRTRPE